MDNVTTFTINGFQNLNGGFGKRKKYNEIISKLIDVEKFHLNFPATVTIKEDLTCITEITVSNEQQKVLFSYPVLKNDLWSFDEISEWTYKNGSFVSGYQVFKNGFFFSDDSMINWELPENRPLGSTFNFHKINVRLKYPTYLMIDWIRKTQNLIASLTLLFKSKPFFRFTDIINVVLNELDVTMDNIAELNIPDLIYVSNGKVIMGTSQNFESIVTISKTRRECTLSNVKVIIDEKGQKTFIADPGYSPDNAEPIFSNLFSNMQREMDFVNDNVKYAV